MALLQMGAIVTQVTGSIAGVTYARNGSGAYARARTKPVDPNSAAQQLAKANMSVVVDSWLTALTVPQRQAWDGAAAVLPRTNKLGQAIHITGQNLFVRSNLSLLLTGQTQVTAPPILPVIPEPSLVLEHLPATGTQVTGIGDWDESVATQTLVSKSPDLRLTINFYKSPFPTRTIEPAAGFGALPLLLTATADLTINTRLYYKFKAVAADGGVSTSVIYQVDVGAVP